jgi:hypothetical protein
VERGIDLVVRRKLEFVRGRLRLGSDNGKGANIMVKELCTFALAFDLDVKVLCAEVHGITDLVL